MIGPASSFYSPEDSAQAQYQQWFDAIDSQHAITQMPYETGIFHDFGRQQNRSTFDFRQGQYPATGSINQYVGNEASIAQSNVSGLDPVAGVAYQNQADIFQPFFDIRSITASSSSSPDQGPVYTPESTLQSFSTTPEQTYPQQQNSQSIFSPTQQPQVKQPSPSSRPTHPPRSLLPRPGRSRQQGSTRHSSSQFKQTSGQTRFAVRPQQAHATSSQSNLSASASSGSQQGGPWANEGLDSAPSSALPSTGSFYYVSATNVTSLTKKDPPSGSQRKTAQGSGSTQGKRKRSRKEGTQESSTISDGDTDNDELAGGISVGMGGIGVVGKGELIGRP